MTNFRPASITEIEHDIKMLPRKSIRHGALEYCDPRTRTGVAHRNHTRSTVRVIDGKAMATIHGQLEEVIADVAEFTGADGKHHAVVCCYRVAWLKA